MGESVIQIKLGTSRRAFLRDRLAPVALATGALALSGCGDKAPAPSPIVWRMRASWNNSFPGLFEAAERLAKRINLCCHGRLKIELRASSNADEAFSVFDDVANGRIEMAHSSAQFWQGRSEASVFFSSLPFGLTAQECTSWLFAGEGLELWRELYAHFGLVPFPVGNSGAQMAGWFKRELANMRSVRGLKMRITGIPAKVWQRIGGVAVNLPGAQIAKAFEDSEIAAAEWMGPWNDLELGLHERARNYYYPGWHDPGSILECIINKRALDALPEDLQASVEAACLASHTEETALMQARNQQALITLGSVHKVNVRKLPADVLLALARASEAVINELSERDKFAKKVFVSAMRFREQARQWQQVSDQAFVTARG